MISEGIIRSDIAKKLNLPKSHVSYYTTRLQQIGFVQKSMRSSYIECELTQAGKKFLDQYRKNNLSLPICRSENIRFKAVVTQMPTKQVDWKKIEMHNWAIYTSEVDGIKVKLNKGNVPTLELLPSPIEGNDPYELFIVYVYDCMNVLMNLYDKIGLKVGRLQLGSRGEWLVYDPIARAFCKHNGQVEYETIGKVNASKPKHIGELEFHDPRALQDYLLMPQRLKNIEELLKDIQSKLT